MARLAQRSDHREAPDRDWLASQGLQTLLDLEEPTQRRTSTDRCGAPDAHPSNRQRKPPSHSWRAFLQNHTQDLVSIDFFVVPTATFRVLYVFLVLEHERRRIVHCNVTDAPATGDTEGVGEGRSAHVVLVGFGPAGQAVAAHLRKEKTPLVLIEWNPALARRADAMGIDTIIGDATRTDVLTRASVGTAKAVAITVPDPTAARTITTSVSDEETGVGLQVAYELQRAFDATESGQS